MHVGDLALLVWAGTVVLLPGATLLALLLGRRPLLVFAGAPVVTVAITYATGLVTGATGLPWGWPVVAVGWAVAAAGAWAAGRRDHGRPSWRTGLSRQPPEVLVGCLGILIAVILATRTFLSALGRLSVLPQEHDMVLHTVVVANIMRTGRGAPWQAFPADLLTGVPGGFYPNGFHQLAALVGAVAPDSVTALNTTAVVLFAVCLVTGTSVLAWMTSSGRRAPVAAAAAALLAAVAYRPVYALLHDGGILANASALAIAPGTIALLLGVSRLGWWSTPAIAAAVLGATAVHPTSAATVGVSVIVWLGVETAVSSNARSAALLRVAKLGAPVIVAGVGLLPFVLAGGGSAGGVSAFPRDFPVQPLGTAIGVAVSSPYGGFLDPTLSLAQAWIAGLAVLGVVVSLWTHRNTALVVTLGIWFAIVTAYLAGASLPGLTSLTGLYYNSYVRLTGPLALLQWVSAGIGVSTLFCAAASRLGRLTGMPTTAQRERRLEAAIAAVGLFGLLAAIAVPYARVNARALAERYSDPAFVRVDDADLDAAAFVAERLSPGERVMNNANDGSTYGYVFYGLPIVVDGTLATGSAPYTIDLLRSFNQLDQNRGIQDEVCDLDIAYVIADAEAPPIWAPPEAFPWVEGGRFSTPPGFVGLGSVRSLILERVFDDVSVYRVDRDRLGC